MLQYYTKPLAGLFSGKPPRSPPKATVQTKTFKNKTPNKTKVQKYHFVMFQEVLLG
jgi:hypothetical protein